MKHYSEKSKSRNLRHEDIVPKSYKIETFTDKFRACELPLYYQDLKKMSKNYRRDHYQLSTMAFCEISIAAIVILTRFPARLFTSASMYQKLSCCNYFTTYN